MGVLPSARWFAVGSAEGLEQEAGARAADEALVGDDAKLLIVFARRRTTSRRGARDPRPGTCR